MKDSLKNGSEEPFFMCGCLDEPAFWLDCLDEPAF
jgi:hypothetical protein